jgi:formamidopyrimidine-DNA glycosylase
VPELPEVEIAARRIEAALKGAEVESVLAPGMVALKSVEPPLDAIVGKVLHGVRRVGKMPVVELGDEGELVLLVHMMSAGRLQVFDERASLRDRRSRVLVRFTDGRELRLREFGTKQRAWAKLLEAGDLAGEEMVATLGPEAWPAPPLEQLAAALDQPRHLHPLLRDQRTIAGIGRSWVDEILWEARLSPFKPAGNLSASDVQRLHDAIVSTLRAAVGRAAGLAAKDLKSEKKSGLNVHARTGLPCPRCGDTIREVSFASKSLQYCPTCQTDGKPLADRRLSRLLK